MKLIAAHQLHNFFNGRLGGGHVPATTPRPSLPPDLRPRDSVDPLTGGSGRAEPSACLRLLALGMESIGMKLVCIFPFERGVKGLDVGHVSVNVAGGLKDGS